MKKAFLFGAIAVVITGAVVAITAMRSDGAKSAVAKGAPKPCLKSDASLQLAQADKDGIDLAATSQLPTVPAGTITDVRVATYDGTTATGSELYPGNYGTYNFTAQKLSVTADNHYNWEITSFVACKP